MRNSDSISSIQLAVIVISTMVGISLLILPKMVTDFVGVAAPLATLIGIVISSMGIIAFALLGKRFPKETLISYNTTILGKVVGNFFNVLFILISLILFGLEARQFAEVLAGALLPNTPFYIPILLMMFVCITINYSNVSTFAYIHFFYLPILIIPLFVVILPSFADAEQYHLFPITGHNVSAKEWFDGAKIICQGISNYIIISMVIPYMKNAKSAVKSSVWGFLVAGSFVLGSVTICLAVFGDKKILDMYWPTLVLARMVQGPSEVLSRVDAIFLTGWIFAVFTTLISYYFIYVRGVAEMFQTRKFRIISWAGTPIAFLIAFIPQDTYELYNYIRGAAFADIFLVIIYPMLLLLLAKILRKKGNHHEKGITFCLFNNCNPFYDSMLGSLRARGASEYPGSCSRLCR